MNIGDLTAYGLLDPAVRTAAQRWREAEDGTFESPGIPVLGNPDLRVLLRIPAGLTRSKAAMRSRLDRDGGAACADRIGASLNLLQRIAPELASACASFVRVVLPLPDTGAVRRSFSCADAPGVVFVSNVDDAPWLAETLVHESAHAALALLEANEPLVADDSEADFYSPWRHDARPPSGILHASFAFTDVATMLLHFAGAGIPGASHRAVLTIHRVDLALRELSRARLSDAGRSLVTATRARLERAARAAGVGESPPISVRAHHLAWRERTAKRPG